jgi:outer membrane protein assembly factor BamB
MAVADDTAFVGTDGRLVAVDLADGTERWTRATDGIARLRVVDGRLYQTTPGLDESTVVARTFEGAERWRTTVPDHVQPLHERDGYVFLGGRDGYHVVHADRGEVVRSDDVQVRALAAAAGALYGASFDVIVRYDVDGPRLATRWRVDSDASVELLAPVVGDAVYAPLWRPGGSDGRVRILADTGTERGRIDLPARPWGLTLTPRGPVVPTGTRLLAGRADGDDRWTVEVNGRPRAVAAGDTVVAADPLLAVDDATGERLWALDVGLVRLLAVAGSTVYAATNDRLVAVRP